MTCGRTIITGLAVLGTILVTEAGAQDPADRGRALLQENCARCHAIGKIDVSPLKGAPPFRIIGQSYELDQFARRLTRGIASSHPDMPEFHFNEEDADAVIAYLRTIQD
jgi:cytochrome c